MNVIKHRTKGVVMGFIVVVLSMDAIAALVLFMGMTRTTRVISHMKRSGAYWLFVFPPIIALMLVVIGMNITDQSVAWTFVLIGLGLFGINAIAQMWATVQVMDQHKSWSTLRQITDEDK